MTSKEEFEKLTFYLSAKNAPEVVWEGARQIEKDLVVLEILKSKIRISNDLDVRMLDYPLFLLPMTKEERDKIKEWLEYKEK